MAFTIRQIKLGLAINALFGYHVSVTMVGLFMHPYQTVQDIVRKGIPASSVIFPTLCWIMGFLVLRLIEHVLWNIVPFLGFWWFLFLWGSLFLLFWQVLLLYLYLRFARSLSK